MTLVSSYILIVVVPLIESSVITSSDSSYGEDGVVKCRKGRRAVVISCLGRFAIVVPERGFALLYKGRFVEKMLDCVQIGKE